MAGRDDILREAAQEAAMLRRCGYPEARVAPEYCIGGEIGPDGFYTKTVCVYAGRYDESSIPRGLRALMP